VNAGRSRPLRVLHAIHDFLPRHRAGSEIYVEALCRAQSRDCRVTVLAAEHDLTRPDGAVRWRDYDGVAVVELVNNWEASAFEDTYQSRLMSRRVSQVLDAVQPDVVHVHNLLNLSFRLPELARARGIAVVATLHDYTLACPSGGQRIHRAESHVCEQIEAPRCARCFAESPFRTLIAAGRFGAVAHRSGLAAGVIRQGARLARSVLRLMPRAARAGVALSTSSTRALPTALDIERRLARAREVFRHIDLVVAPSASMAREMASLGFTGTRVEVSDYGFAPVTIAPRSKDPERVRFGFLGTLVWHKGVHLLLDALRDLPSSGWELQIHGDDRVFPDYARTLRAQSEGLPVRFCGGFEHAEVAGILRRVDALVVPSIWLENSPLVIHEAMMARIPVIGARIGGIAELIEDGVHGWLYDPHSIPDLARTLRMVIDDPSEIERRGDRAPVVKAIATDAREWLKRYESLERPRSEPLSL
jgi:glycosyltransferase involved in cell wall biosynthesis